MKEEPVKARALRDLISQVQDDRLRGLIEAGLSLDRISQRLQRPEISDETRDAFMDSNPPLPALLVSFKRNDSIVGVFVTLSREFGNPECAGKVVVDRRCFLCFLVPSRPLALRSSQ
jgi:hypothetical protein